MARRRRDEDEPTPSRWWLLTGEAMTSSLWGWVDRLASRSRAENLLDLIHEAIYEGRPVSSARDYPAIEHLRRQRNAPADLNLPRSMVDTVQSRLGKRRPMPVISADDAGWGEKLFAMRASRVIRRKMGQPVVERLCPKVLRDCIIRGTGVAHAYRNGGDVALEEVPRHELVVDPRDGRYGAPRVMARVKPVNRDVLCDMFPDRRDDIMAAAATDRTEWTPHEYDSTLQPDEVEVAAAWHLPSGPEAEDGAYVMCIRGFKPLCCVPWKRQRFPFGFMHWSAPTRGFWGHGLVEDLAGIQAKVSDMLKDAQVAAAFAGKLKLFAQRNANINKNHLRAPGTTLIETDGPVPAYLDATPQVQHQLAVLDWLINRAYEIAGISQASAASKNPLGSNASGKALDTMYDIESDRFSSPELNYAMFRVDLGMIMLDVARDIAEDKDDDCEPAAWIKEIDWRKVDVDAGDYRLVLEPQNFIPESRAGRLSTVKEMADAGLLTNQLQTMALFDEPDIKRMNRYQLGPYYNLESLAMDVGDVDVPLEECVPDPHMVAASKGMAKDMMIGMYCYAASEKASEVVLGRYRWCLKMLDEVEKELASAATGAAGPVPPPPMAPGGPPMPGDPAAMGAPPMPPMVPPPMPGAMPMPMGVAA